MQELRKDIEAGFYCEKAKQSGLIRVFNADGTNPVNVKQPNGTLIVQVKNLAAFFPWCDLMSTGAANTWFIVGGQQR